MVTGKSYTETLTELHSVLELPTAKSGHGIDLQELCDRFLELLAFYSSNTLDKTRDYIEEAKMHRIKNLFPYFFNILPNRFMVKTIPNFSLAKPLTINYGEILTAKAIPQRGQLKRNKKSLPVVHCQNILDTTVVPFNKMIPDYNIAKKALEIKFSGKSQFIMGEKPFDLWINYGGNPTESIFLYSLFYKRANGKIRIRYADNQISELTVKPEFNPEFTMHPNFNVKLMLDSPEFFLRIRLNILNMPTSIKKIKDFTLFLHADPAIQKYNLNKAFHVNYLPVINLHREYAQVIEYDSTKDSYPMLHPVSDSFHPYFIRSVTYDTGSKSGRVLPEILSPRKSESSYKVVSQSNLLGKRYDHLAINLPEDVLNANVTVLAEWTQLYDHDLKNLEFTFFNKQVGSFEFEKILYHRFITPASSNYSGNILGMLKLHNTTVLQQEDFRLLLQILVGKESSLRPLINDFLDMKIISNNRDCCKYDLIFRESDVHNHAMVEMMVKGIEDFLKGNLGFEKTVTCSVRFKATQKDDSIGIR